MDKKEDNLRNHKDNMYRNHQHNRSINRTELYNVTQCEQKQSKQYSKN